MEASMCVYGLSFICTLIMSSQYQKSLENKSNKTVLLFLLTILPLIFLSTFRKGVGTDYYSYVSLYVRTSRLTLKEAILSLEYGNEPGILLLAKISQLLFNSEVGFFFLSSLIIHLFILLGFTYYKKNISISWAMFIYLMLMFPTGLNIVRQMMSMAIVLFATKFILEKKFSKYFIFIFIAATFHNTAFIFIFLYIFAFSGYSRITHLFKYSFYFFIIFSPLLMYGFMYYFFDFISFVKYSKYFNIENFKPGLGFLMYTLPILMPQILFNKLFDNNEKKLFYINLLLIPFGFLGYLFDYGARLNQYLYLISSLTIPIIIFKLKNRNTKILIKIFYIIFFIFYYLYIFVILNSAETYPYSFIFNM